MATHRRWGRVLAIVAVALAGVAEADADGLLVAQDMNQVVGIGGGKDVN